MRAGLLAAVLLLVAACAGASPTPSPEPVRILATGLPSIGQIFTVHLVTDSTDYTNGWHATGRPDPPPAVDFATEVAIYFGMAGSSSCPPEFQHLVVDDAAARVYAEWNDATLASRPCTDDLQQQGVAIAVSRSVLPAGQFTLSLRSDVMCPECPDHPDRVQVTVR